MSVINIESELKNIIKIYKIDTYQPVLEKQIENFEEKNGPLPADLKMLYEIINGLDFESFRVLPFFDATDKKRTWDSLERANDKLLTKFNVDESFLDNFLIFSEIGGMQIAVFDKQEHAIWFEDAEGYHKTNLTLIEFISGMCEEISV